MSGGLSRHRRGSVIGPMGAVPSQTVDKGRYHTEDGRLRRGTGGRTAFPIKSVLNGDVRRLTAR
jgi:hypothetical protein